MSLPSSYLGLTAKQRLYVDGRMQGLSKVAAARAAGFAAANAEASKIDANPKVQQAMLDRMQQNADEVDFGRKEAHAMYMEAYQNAETAMEQIAAVNALVKLHGIDAPKKLMVEHEHTHKGEIEFMPTEELMRLANMEEKLVLPGEFEEVKEPARIEHERSDSEDLS